MDMRALLHIDPAGSSPPVARQMPHPNDGGPGSTRLTVSLSTDLVERLRDTVVGISQGTLSGLVTQAIEEALRQLEAGTPAAAKIPLGPCRPVAGKPGVGIEIQIGVMRSAPTFFMASRAGFM